MRTALVRSCPLRCYVWHHAALMERSQGTASGRGSGNTSLQLNACLHRHRQGVGTARDCAAPERCCAAAALCSCSPLFWKPLLRPLPPVDIGQSAAGFQGAVQPHAAPLLLGPEPRDSAPVSAGARACLVQSRPTHFGSVQRRGKNGALPRCWSSSRGASGA